MTRTPSRCEALNACVACAFHCCSLVLQICSFLRLDPSPIPERLYACALLDSLTAHQARSDLPLTGKRPRPLSPLAAFADPCTAQVHQLLSKPDVAEAALTAPCTRQGSTPLSLTQLHHALPAALFGAAARGYFGVRATAWTIDVASDRAMDAARRTVQVLPRHVTAVCLTGDMAGRQRSQLLSQLAQATQLVSVSLNGQQQSEFLAQSWLQRLTPLTNLQRLEVQGCRLAAFLLPDLAPALTQLRGLKTLVLEGRSDEFMGKCPVCTPFTLQKATAFAKHDAGMVALAHALAALTALTRLGLPWFRTGHAGARALGPVLAQMPQLRSINMSRMCASPHSAVVAEGLAACSQLTELSLHSSELTEECAATHSLGGMHGTLRKLTLDLNVKLGCAGVNTILFAPALLSLTSLSLAFVGLAPAAGGGATMWPWRNLRALTALQVLNLACNGLRNPGAESLAAHIGALVQLRALDVYSCGITNTRALSRALFGLPRLRRLACTQKSRMMVPFVVPPASAARGVELVSELGE